MMAASEGSIPEAMRASRQERTTADSPGLQELDPDRLSGAAPSVSRKTSGSPSLTTCRGWADEMADGKEPHPPVLPLPACLFCCPLSILTPPFHLQPRVLSTIPHCCVPFMPALLHRPLPGVKLPAATLIAWPQIDFQQIKGRPVEYKLIRHHL